MSAADDRPVETPRQWLRYAEGDLTVAQREIHTPEPVYHTVCFLCQGAAEKFLKGFLISRGWSLEKTHDLVALLGWCAEYEAGFAGLTSRPRSSTLDGDGKRIGYDIAREDGLERVGKRLAGSLRH